MQIEWIVKYSFLFKKLNQIFSSLYTTLWLGPRIELQLLWMKVLRQAGEQPTVPKDLQI